MVFSWICDSSLSHLCILSSYSQNQLNLISLPSLRGAPWKHWDLSVEWVSQERLSAGIGPWQDSQGKRLRSQVITDSWVNVPQRRISFHNLFLQFYIQFYLDVMSRICVCIVIDNLQLYLSLSIAQLVEQWTVVVQLRTSIGHWFESGW